MSSRRYVVVGLDGSDRARRALAWAADFADRRSASLRVVGSWSYPSSAAFPGAADLCAPEEQDARVSAMLRERLAELGRPDPADGGDVVVVGRGPAARVILGEVGTDTEAVVVGSRGLGTVSGRVLGSVSRRVAEWSTAPVVVVPDDEHPLAGPLVVGVDGSPAAAAARDWAISIADITGRGAVLVHGAGEPTPRASTSSLERGVVLVHGVSGLPAEMPPSAIDRFVAQARHLVDEHAEHVRAAGVPVRTVVEMADPRVLLHQVATDLDAALVVVGAAGEGPVSGHLIGSVVSHVVQQSDRPVAVVHAR